MSSHVPSTAPEPHQTAPVTVTPPSPGWYPNPHDPFSTRYIFWDGAQWSKKGPGQKNPWWAKTIIAVVLLAGAFVALPVAFIAGVYAFEAATGGGKWMKVSEGNVLVEQMLTGTSQQGVPAEEVSGYEVYKGDSLNGFPPFIEVTVPASDVERVLGNMNESGVWNAPIIVEDPSSSKPIDRGWDACRNTVVSEVNYCIVRGPEGSSASIEGYTHVVDGESVMHVTVRLG